MKRIILVLAVILGVTGICGCTDSGSNSTKHFDNGVFAFDYPSNMELSDDGMGGIYVKNGSTPIIHMLIHNYTSNPNLIINDSSMKNQDPGVNITKVTINGRTAYNVTHKSENSTTNLIVIDIGTGQMEISPNTYSGVSDQKETPTYPVYQMIVNSFQVK